MQPLRVTVWCGLCSEGIIDLYFYQKDDGASIIINGATYHIMINDFIVPTLHGIDVNDIWFEQDAAIYHNRFIVSNISNLVSNLAKYIRIHNSSLKPLTQDYNLDSHTTSVVCVLIL